VKYKTN